MFRVRVAKMLLLHTTDYIMSNRVLRLVNQVKHGKLTTKSGLADHDNIGIHCTVIVVESFVFRNFLNRVRYVLGSPESAELSQDI